MGPARSRPDPDNTIRVVRIRLACSIQRARLVCCAKEANRLLENSCHDCGNRWHSPRGRDSFAKQEIRYARITGISPEFLGSGDRPRRNFLYRRVRKLSNDQLRTDKPANSLVNRRPFEFRIIARIF
jgi:hypothetical protein